MPRLIVSLDGVVVKEVQLTKDRSTIGRRPYNDVVIDHLAVSGEHAVIHLTGGQVTIDDLGSTNGTYVNGRPIRRQVLRHDDVIEVGKAKVRFVEGDAPSTAPATLPTPMPAAQRATAPDSDGGSALIGAPVTEPATLPASMAGARVRVLSGAAAGREMALIKVVTTIGKPGRSVASIIHKPHGFELTHVEGEPVATVNGIPAAGSAIALKNHDEIELGGIRLEFLDYTPE